MEETVEGIKIAAVRCTRIFGQGQAFPIMPCCKKVHSYLVWKSGAFGTDAHDELEAY